MTRSRSGTALLALALIASAIALPSAGEPTPQPAGAPTAPASCTSLIDDATSEVPADHPYISHLRSLCATAPDRADHWIDDLVEQFAFLHNPIPNPGAEAPTDVFAPAASTDATWVVEGADTVPRRDGDGRAYRVASALTFNFAPAAAPSAVRGGDTFYVHVLEGQVHAEIVYADGTVVEADLDTGRRIVDLLERTDGGVDSAVTRIELSAVDGVARVDDLRLDGVCYGGSACRDVDQVDVGYRNVDPRIAHDGFAVLIVPYDHALSAGGSALGRLQVWVGVVHMTPSGAEFVSMAEARDHVQNAWLVTKTPGDESPTFHRPFPGPRRLAEGDLGAYYATEWSQASPGLDDAAAAPGWVFSVSLKEAIAAERALGGWIVEPEDTGPGGSPERFHYDFHGQAQMLGYYNEEKLQTPWNAQSDQLDLVPSQFAVGAWVPLSVPSTAGGVTGGSPADDPDGDGHVNGVDNCDTTYNKDQRDTDGDGQGNECDGDDDGDGVRDEEDAFPRNPDESEDTDGDGAGDHGDNCPGTPNAEQGNADDDGQGDACDADDDADGLDDAAEADHGTNRTDPDTDADALEDGAEVHTHGSDPLIVDTDGDGLDDGPEVHDHGTDPAAADTDRDALDDGAEVDTHDTDPTNPDTDGDGLPDGTEIQVGADPHVVDTDGDGLDDGPEFTTYGSDPTEVDSDRDGLDDGPEVHELGSDPMDDDSDGDGLADGREIKDTQDPQGCDEAEDPAEGARHEVQGDDCDGGHGTDPADPDTDGDALDDGPEIQAHGTNATDPDTDGDSLEDGAEVHDHGTDPNRPDTDGDSLEDGAEVHDHGSDPTERDTDGDGYADGDEVDAGSSPVDPASTPIDLDGDDVNNEKDNCAETYNPSQTDADGDGVGDVCDPDRDGDDVDNVEDNCAGTPNADQADADGDGVGDACDEDPDGDGIPSGRDNCDGTPNADQPDLDRDGRGDACDDRVDIDRIQITPASPTQTAGSTSDVTFQVKARNRQREVFDLDPTHVAWSLDDPAGGTFTGATLAPSDTAGSYTVRAELEARRIVQDTAELTIQPGPIRSLKVACDDETVVAGRVADCRAVGEDAHGNADPDVDAAWSATDGHGDPYRVTPDGRFKAPTSVEDGPINLTATVDDATATATVDVAPGNLAQVRVETRAGPAGKQVGRLDLAVGDNVTLHAVARDRYGNFLADIGVDWSVHGDAVLDLPQKRSSRADVTAASAGTARIRVRTSGGLIDRTGAIRVVDEAAPSRVRNLSSSTHEPGAWTSNRTVRLDWDAASDDGDVAGYLVKLDGDKRQVTRTRTRVPLPGDGSWTIRVAAVDAAGNVGPYADFGPLKLDRTPPMPPEDVSRVEVDDDTVEIRWTTPTDEGSGVAAFAIYRVGARQLEQVRTVQAQQVTLPPVEDGYRVAAIDHAGLRSPPIRAGSQGAVNATGNVAERVQQVLGLDSKPKLSARDANGDGTFDAVSADGVAVRRSLTIDGHGAVLVTPPDGDAKAIWVPRTSAVHEVDDVDARVAEVRRQDGGAEVDVVVANKTGWIAVDVDDPAPGMELAGVETGDGRTLPASQVWRRDGRVHFLDDPTTTYTLVYSGAQEDVDRTPGGLPAALPMPWILIGLAAVAVAGGVATWVRSSKEGSS